MWNMMCDVMPTISEDNISQRSSQFSGEDANFEQLMVSMLDERDKLVESLRETQERLGDAELRLKEVEKERDSLQRQIAANLPQSVYFPKHLQHSKVKRNVFTAVIAPGASKSTRPTRLIALIQTEIGTLVKVDEIRLTLTLRADVSHRLEV
ncbi:Liprin-alpha-3 [Eumeta japonica]|uniref:Liprin-alpha-3 n=1 Tax=Eumeta variegata TaxID=151549 RepID=A0A4C1W824_EUMVA|nr:Liprin-alpha-3 [Eumeta japonica]